MTSVGVTGESVAGDLGSSLIDAGLATDEDVCCASEVYAECTDCEVWSTCKAESLVDVVYGIPAVLCVHETDLSVWSECEAPGLTSYAACRCVDESDCATDVTNVIGHGSMSGTYSCTDGIAEYTVVCAKVGNRHANCNTTGVAAGA